MGQEEKESDAYVKKPLRRPWFFPHLRDTGPEANRAVAAVQSGASHADILAPLAQSGGDRGVWRHRTQA